METEKNPRQEYWETVESIAQEAQEAEKRGEDASDHIHESVDGSHYVIYTYANLVCLQESENEDAAFEVGDGLGDCGSYCALMARLAYWAMRQDVDDAFAELPEVEEPEEP